MPPLNVPPNGTENPAFDLWLSPPEIDESDHQTLAEALASGWAAPRGPHLKAFELALCAHTGRQFALAVNSGTAAIHLGLLALELSPGDEVICPTHTFAASANPVVYTGAKPVFVDSAAFQLHNPGQARIEEHISPVHLAEAIEHRIKLGRKPAALILAHLYGRMDPNVAELVQRWDIPLVEDAAEGFGATLNGRPAGSFGAASALSFNGNKLLTTSGGGALLTDDETLYKRARYFASQAREPAVHYEHSNIGYNYRLSNLLAALGLSQLKRINAKMEARKRINDAYRQRLGTLPGVYFPEPEAGVTPSNWLTVLYIDAERSGTTRDAILSALRASGVEARPTWKPMHLQPVYAQAAFYGNRTQGPAAQQFATGLCLPSGGGLSVTDLDRICRVVEHCFKGQLVQP